MAGITLKHLEAFVAVADRGSFRRAAEGLNTTQPNISSRIAALEAQLSVRLMARDAGSVRLTAKGAALLPKAREVLGAVDALLVTAGDDLLFEGVLRLGVTEMVVHSWLGAYLAALKGRFPRIEVDLTVDLSANLSAGLAERSLDLALQSGPFARPMGGAEDLGSFPYVWVAAPGLGLGQRALTLADLSARPVLTHTRGTLPYSQLRDHVAGASVRLVPSTNMSACLQMTREGLGIACLPEVMVRGELDSGKLEALRYPWRPDNLRFEARFDAATAPHFVREAAVLAREVAHRG